jgi:hypothetical protein
MDATQGIVEPVTMSEVLELATWDRPRSDEEIENFISSREAAISGK